MTQILAIAGEKQSGKSSAVNFLHGYTLKETDEEGKFQYRIKDTGELAVTVSDADGNTSEGGLDINQKNLKFVEWAEWRIWPHIKGYNFAETLKDICVEVLGLNWEQVHGTDLEKNSFTQLCWDDMPGVITPERMVNFPGWDENDFYKTAELMGLIIKNSGPMTAREVMQFVGTDVFRKMHTNVWVDQVLKQIVSDHEVYGTELAVIGDCRFRNEVEAVKKAGGKVVYLTRSVDGNPTHASENDLAGFDGFDVVIDNRNLNMTQTHQALFDKLVDLGLFARESDRRGVASARKKKEYIRT